MNPWGEAVLGPAPPEHLNCLEARTPGVSPADALMGRPREVLAREVLAWEVLAREVLGVLAWRS